MLAEKFPAELEEVFTHFLTCEFTTIARDGTPISWPVLPIFYRQRGQFLLFTSIGLPQKAFNIRREPRVSMLYSEPTGSGLESPPAVLVQGKADAPDQIITSLTELEPDLVEMLRAQVLDLAARQPGMKLYTMNGPVRWLMDWYFMRLLITITPHRVYWWEGGDFTRPPHKMEVNHVG